MAAARHNRRHEEKKSAWNRLISYFTWFIKEFSSDKAAHPNEVVSHLVEKSNLLFDLITSLFIQYTFSRRVSKTSFNIFVNRRARDIEINSLIIWKTYKKIQLHPTFSHITPPSLSNYEKYLFGLIAANWSSNCREMWSVFHLVLRRYHEVMSKIGLNMM